MLSRVGCWDLTDAAARTRGRPLLFAQLLLTQRANLLTLLPTMSIIFPRLMVGVAVLFGVGVLPAQEPKFMPAPYERLTPMPEQGVVLLRNGQAIEGRITRAGDLYYVVLPEGEIRLKAAEVELCCRNLEEGYLRKRAAITADTVEEHLRLAQWCQRQGLLKSAAAELADARRIDPRHPMIGILEHRLQMALEPPPKPAAPSTAPGVSFETLDQMVRGLPSGTVEEFTQAIQPILMNHCATGGCHGPQGESKMHLLRIPNGRPATHRLTQRNLYEVVQLIDREKPDASPLLAAASKPHGSARAAIFNDRQSGQYQRLVKWVNEVAGHTAAQAASSPGDMAPSAIPGRRNSAYRTANAKPGALPPHQATPIPTTPPTPPLPTAVQPAAAVLPVPSGKPRTPALPQPDADEPPQKHPAVKRGAAIEPFVPNDPFDPEVFNRRYFRAPAEQPP
jgi:hypothetical protein